MAPIGPSAPRAARMMRKSTVIARGVIRPDGLRIVANIGLRSAQTDRRDRLARPANPLVVEGGVRRARGPPRVHRPDHGPGPEGGAAGPARGGPRAGPRAPGPPAA